MQSNKKITDKRRFSVVMKITAIVIVMAVLIGSTAIYAGYYLHSTTMNQYYKNQVVNISKEIPPTVSEGEYGWLCSGYEPIYSEDGKAIALIGVDISMNEVVGQQMDFLKQMLTWLIILTLIIVILVICYFRYTLTKPLQKLAGSAQTFVARREEKGSKEPVQTAISDLTIKSNDEIRDLYDSIRQMETDIFHASMHIPALSEP